MENNKIKFLPPNNTEWQKIETDSDEQEEKTECDKNKKDLNELLLSSMQMQNIIVLSGSGTSLGNAGGPSMFDLWESCTKESGVYTETAKKVSGKVKYDGLVKSRKTDFLPQHIGIMQDDVTICCGQNKMLGLFTRPSNMMFLMIKKLISKSFYRYAKLFCK